MTKELLEIALASVAYLCFGAAYATEKRGSPSEFAAPVVPDTDGEDGHQHVVGPPKFLLYIVYGLTVLFWWGFVLGDIWSWGTDKLISLSAKSIAKEIREKREKEEESKPGE